MLANLGYYLLPCLPLHVEAVSKSPVSSSECIAHQLFLRLPCDAAQFCFAFFYAEMRSRSCTLKLACFWFGLFWDFVVFGFFLWDSGLGYVLHGEGGMMLGGLSFLSRLCHAWPKPGY